MKSTLFFLLFFSANFLFSQSNSDCIDCHSDNELSNVRNGKNVSLFVNELHVNNSAHKNLNCIDCHKGFDAEDIPHKSGSNIYKVDCATCHKEIAVQTKTDIHHRLKEKVGSNLAECMTCHTHHNVKPINLIGDKSDFFCSTCHESSKQAKGFHKKVFVESETCAECHDEVEEHSIKTHRSNQK